MKMSPASKSKTKDKKAVKEPPKSASKPSGSSNSSAYNPLLGTFHPLETGQTSSGLPLQANGRFRNIDETDDHSGGLGAEYDSVSNTGSWSGESEDHKEKSSNPLSRLEAIPPGADNDKREKIRQKNEKKHQRQKERRAQELHERCSGYLMSRKLEALAQQLVSMGFSHERATMALILNEGKVEESVSWLFEGGEDADKQMDKKLSGASLKIDISEELAQIADMEIRFKCSKQEVERAVVSSEGDLEKAVEIIQKQKQESSGSPKLHETGDLPTFANNELSTSQNLARVQSKPIPTPSTQQRKEARDFNYPKLGVTAVFSGPVDSSQKIGLPVKRIIPNVDWGKPQHAAGPDVKRWPVPGSSPPISYTLMSSPVQASASQAKVESRFVASGGEVKNFQPGSVREPVIMMQRPQSSNLKQASASYIGSPPGSGSNWSPTNSLEFMKLNGLSPQFPPTGNRNLAQTSLGGSSQVFNQHHIQQQQQFSLGNGLGDVLGLSHGNGSWIRNGATPTLAAVSSLGLFSGLGATSGAASPVDWTNGGSTIPVDYSNIDWTLDQGLSSRSGKLWLGLANFVRENANNGYDFGTPVADAKPVMRSALNGNGSVPFPGLQLQDPGAETTAMGSREWTSPFEGNDLFSLPRRFVSSPPPL